MEHIPMEWFFEIPIVTRTWVCSILSVSALEGAGLVSYVKLIYNFSRVRERLELWRLLTTFIYFGPLSWYLLLDIFFVTQYCGVLESSFYRNRPGDFAWIFFIASGCLLLVASISGNIDLLGPCLSSTMMYLWSRRSPETRVSFFGLFELSISYLPWLQALLSFAQKNVKSYDSILGIAVGHFLFFFEDIYPQLSGGKRVLSPPWTWFKVVEHEQT